MAKPTELSSATEARKIADDILEYSREPYPNLPAWTGGYLKSAAQAVVDDPSPRNLAHLANTLAGIALAEREHAAELARGVAEAQRRVAELDRQSGGAS
jgi:hypothetical protein